MWRWYKDVVDPLTPSPSPINRVAIELMVEERVELLRNIPSPGFHIPVGVTPFLVL